MLFIHLRNLQHQYSITDLVVYLVKFDCFNSQAANCYLVIVNSRIVIAIIPSMDEKLRKVIIIKLLAIVKEAIIIPIVEVA